MFGGDIILATKVPSFYESVPVSICKQKLKVSLKDENPIVWESSSSSENNDGKVVINLHN